MFDKPSGTMTQEPWEPPRELTGPTPRRFEWKAAGVANMAMIVVIFIVGLAFFGDTCRSGDESKRLREEGLITDGAVTRTWSESSRGTMHYKVAYEFSAAGTRTSGESEVSQSSWKELQVGSHTTVKYVPGQVDYNRLSIGYDTQTPFWVTAVVFVFWIVLLAVSIPPIVKERRLLKYGRAAPGIVTKVKRTSWGRSYAYTLSYQFQISGGTTMNGKARRDLPSAVTG